MKKIVCNVIVLTAVLLFSQMVYANNFGLQSYFLGDPYEQEISLSFNGYYENGALAYPEFYFRQKLKLLPNLYFEHDIYTMDLGLGPILFLNADLYYLINNRLTLDLGIDFSVSLDEIESYSESLSKDLEVSLGGEYMFLKGERYSSGLRLDVAYLKSLYFQTDELSEDVFLLGQYNFSPKFTASAVVGYLRTDRINSTPYVVNSFALGTNISYEPMKYLTLYLDYDFLYRNSNKSYVTFSNLLNLSLSNMKKSYSIRDINPGYYYADSSLSPTEYSKEPFEHENVIKITDKLLANYYVELKISSTYIQEEGKVDSEYLYLYLSSIGELQYTINDKWSVELDAGALVNYSKYPFSKNHYFSLSLSLFPKIEYKINDKLSIKGETEVRYTNNVSSYQVRFSPEICLEYSLTKGLSIVPGVRSRLYYHPQDDPMFEIFITMFFVDIEYKF